MGFTTPSLSRSLTILATKHAHCKRRNTSTNCIISLSAMSPLARPWRWPSISYKITETVTTRSSKRNFVNSTSLVRGLDVMAPRQQEERVDCLSLPVHVVNRIEVSWTVYGYVMRTGVWREWNFNEGFIDLYVLLCSPQIGSLGAYRESR